MYLLENVVRMIAFFLLHRDPFLIHDYVRLKEITDETTASLVNIRRHPINASIFIPTKHITLTIDPKNLQITPTTRTFFFAFFPLALGFCGWAWTIRPPTFLVFAPPALAFPGRRPPDETAMKPSSSSLLLSSSIFSTANFDF